ncbi:hypothetical protein KY360_02340 [Candidatus Woesearchaeota archaeon]|nr:hypothetical protein [Candidatus Woesearchaeota archaeon]
MEEIRSGSPVFVKIDEYKDVLEVVGIIKDKIEDARNTLGKINELKNEEDSQLEVWNSKLEEIEKKIEFIDKSLFQPESL